MPVASALIWIEPEQADFVRAACEAAGLSVALAGSPTSGKSREIAEALGAEPIDDLRATLARAENVLVLLGTPEGIDVTVDSESQAACADRGVSIASLEPLPASILDVRRGDPGLDDDEGMGLSLGPEPAETPGADVGEEWAAFVPLARLSRPMRDAAEIIAQLGTLSMVSVQAFSGPGQGSLGARLYDSVELVLWLLGQPDRIDAAYVAPSSARGRGVHAIPGESLRGLVGDLSANLRFGDGRAASIVASSNAGRWSRAVTLVGENGRVRIYDDGLEWIGADGRIIDASRDAARVRGSAATDTPIAPAVRALADQLSRIADIDRAPDQPTNVTAVLATAGAALLSARTGEGESPDTILRMARAG
jgi:hypothetical protein